jgi:carbonic anhydrase
VLRAKRANQSDIRARSPIIKELEDAGSLKIVGGVYDMDTGRVNLIE